MDGRLLVVVIGGKLSVTFLGSTELSGPLLLSGISDVEVRGGTAKGTPTSKDLLSRSIYTCPVLRGLRNVRSHVGKLLLYASWPSSWVAVGDLHEPSKWSPTSRASKAPRAEQVPSFVSHFTHKRVMSSMAKQESLHGSPMKLVSILDGLGPDDDRSDVGALSVSILSTMACHARQAH
ncbi:hypothetical protein JHK85_000993 [Glycine max]|nr:hypothetical protein JHK85_000993 [Glycine max]